MIQIRPVTDLRTKYSEIEQIIKEGDPVYFTKNGYGTAVLLSLEKYTELTESADYIEMLLDEADREAEETDVRHEFDEVFSRLSKKYA
jgi:prevent-host-death family protein